MFCLIHPDRIAVDKCHKCSKGVCQECQKLVKGQIFCPPCAPVFVQAAESKRPREPVAAALLSLFCPGLGQIYNGELTKALLIFISSALIVPWLYGAFDAYKVAQRINRGEQIMLRAKMSVSTCMILGIVLWLAPLMTRNALRRYYNVTDADVAQNVIEQRLKKISSALEKFMKDKGHYPRNFKDLYFSTPPYIDEIFCNTELEGYRYGCTFSIEGYTITAVPVREGAKEKKYAVTTGGQVRAE